MHLYPRAFDQAEKSENTMMQNQRAQKGEQFIFFCHLSLIWAIESASASQVAAAAVNKVDS